VIKIGNSMFLENHLLNLLSTFSVVLTTCIVFSILTINHTRIIRADLQFISIEAAVAGGALVSQLAPGLAKIDSLDQVLLGLYVVGLGLFKASELVYLRKVKQEREVQMSVISALRGKPSLVGKFAQKLKESKQKGLNKVTPVQ